MVKAKKAQKSSLHSLFRIIVGIDCVLLLSMLYMIFMISTAWNKVAANLAPLLTAVIIIFVVLLLLVIGMLKRSKTALIGRGIFALISVVFTIFKIAHGTYTKGLILDLYDIFVLISIIYLYKTKNSFFK